MPVIKSIDQSQANKSRHAEVDQSSAHRGEPEGQLAAPRGLGTSQDRPGASRELRLHRSLSGPISTVSKKSRRGPSPQRVARGASGCLRRRPPRRGAPREGQVRPPAEPRLRLLSRALVCDWYCHHLTQEQVEAPGGREGRGACSDKHSGNRRETAEQGRVWNRPPEGPQVPRGGGPPAAAAVGGSLQT